jgi:hypothetical protein
MYDLGTPSATASAPYIGLPNDHAIRTRFSRVMMGADVPVLSRTVADTLGALADDTSPLQPSLVLGGKGIGSANTPRPIVPPHGSRRRGWTGLWKPVPIVGADSHAHGPFPR